MEKGVSAERLSLCHGNSDGESVSDETHSKPRDKIFSPVEKQLITVKGRANFVLEQSGTTYCNLLCVSWVRASFHQEHILEIRYVFQYKVLSGKSHLPAKALSPSFFEEEGLF